MHDPSPFERLSSLYRRRRIRLEEQVVPYRAWRNNHVFISLSLVGVLSAGVAAIGSLSGAYDSGHTSQEELEVVIAQVTQYSLQSKCRSLDIQISLAENAIWQMVQASDSSRRLVEKKRDLKNLQDQYEVARCSTVLAGG